MESAGWESAKFAKSYLLACLASNVPNSYYSGDTYEDILFDSLDYLIMMTSELSNVKEWGEVNELKYLFRSAQPWDLPSVNKFLVDARSFMEQFR